MKKRSRAVREEPDDLRPEYGFDYTASRPNPYAEALKDRAIAVVLDPEVAQAFPTSDSVNNALRAVMAAVPRRSVRTPPRKPTQRSNNQLQRTRSAKGRRRGPRR
jgi:hypothetical protein